MDRVINISTALNERYVPYTYTMIYSLFKNNPSALVRVFLLFGELTESSLLEFKRLGERFGNEIIFCSIDREKLPAELPVGDIWRLEIYFRLFLVDILPADVDRLLYLDGDIIINNPLEGFYDMDFDDKDLIVCKDLGIKEDNLEFHKNNRHEKMRFIVDLDTYFNSGVMLMNIEKLRGFVSLRKYLDVADKFNYEVFAPDQDILNYVHYGRVKYVDPYIYDLLTDIVRDQGMNYEKVISLGTVIYHYTGDKPWAGDRIHYDIEKIWWSYAADTPYVDWLKDKFIEECIGGGGVFQVVSKLRSDLKVSLDSFNKLYSLINAASTKPD